MTHSHDHQNQQRRPGSTPRESGAPSSRAVANHAPATDDLLAEARSVLVDSVLPALRGAERYQALMVANALGMAVRELQQASQPPTEADVEPVDEAALAEAIRRRKAPDDRALRATLRSLTVARLRINNPGYLHDRDQPPRDLNPTDARSE